MIYTTNMFVDMPSVFHMLSIFGYSPHVQKLKLKHAKINKSIHVTITCGCISLTVDYLMHVSFHASKYTRYMEYYAACICVQLYVCKCYMYTYCIMYLKCTRYMSTRYL